MAMLLQLSLCVVTAIQLTSSQSTYDVIQQENDVNSCGRSEQVLSQLVAANLQLQRDVAELKAAIGHKDVKDKLRKQRGQLEMQQSQQQPAKSMLILWSVKIRLRPTCKISSR